MSVGRHVFRSRRASRDVHKLYTDCAHASKEICVHLCTLPCLPLEIVDKKISQWPAVRTDPGVKNGLLAILKQVGSNINWTDLSNAILADALAQIQSEAPLVPLSPTVLWLRKGLGRESLQDADRALSEMMNQVENRLKIQDSRIRDLERQLAAQADYRAAETEPTARAAEEPGPSSRRKRSAP